MISLLPDGTWQFDTVEEARAFWRRLARTECRAWTPKDNALFSKLWASGVSAEAIAEQTGRSCEAVRQHRARLHLPSRKRVSWPPTDNDLFKRLWLAGVLGRDIADHLGRDYRALRVHRRKLGLPPRRPGRTTIKRPTVADVLGQTTTAAAYPETT